MTKKQNKTNKENADKIQNAFKSKDDSETSISGYKQRQREPSFKNLKK